MAYGTFLTDRWKWENGRMEEGDMNVNGGKVD